MVSSDLNVNVSVSPRGSRCSSKPWGTGTQKPLNKTEAFPQCEAYQLEENKLLLLLSKGSTAQELRLFLSIPFTPK